MAPLVFVVVVHILSHDYYHDTSVMSGTWMEDEESLACEKGQSLAMVSRKFRKGRKEYPCAHHNHPCKKWISEAERFFKKFVPDEEMIMSDDYIDILKE